MRKFINFSVISGFMIVCSESAIMQQDGRRFSG